MNRIRKQFFAVLMSGIFAVVGSLCPLMVYAKEQETENRAAKEEWNWTYGYTGTEQVFRAPYSGIYQFELYGAQGGRTDSMEGGKGGKVTASVALSKNEEIMIYVGGADGFNGGGTGTLSNGGGATDIRQGGRETANRILVAGGGGGANRIYSGLNGGVHVSSSASGSGNGENAAEGAGGGGGCIGGTSGTEHIVAHTHTGYGGSCYVPDYHTHIGNESVYGGCYIVPKQRTEPVTTDYIWTRGSEIDSGTFTGDVVEGESDVISHFHWKKYQCIDQYGHTAVLNYVYWASETSARKNAGCWVLEGSADYTDSGQNVEFTQTNYGTDWNQLWDTFTTQKTTQNIITYFDLGCGLEAGGIAGYHLECSKDYDEYTVGQASGGTNYYDTDKCANAVSEAGIKSGDGVCNIKLLGLYNLYYSGSESRHIYYNGIKIKRVYYEGSLIYRE